MGPRLQKDREFIVVVTTKNGKIPEQDLVAVDENANEMVNTNLNMLIIDDLVDEDRLDEEIAIIKVKLVSIHSLDKKFFVKGL